MVSPYPGRAYEGTLVPNMLALALGREAIAWATLLTDFTLQDLEDRLPPATFERVHRRALINLEQLACLDPLETGGYTARMHTGGLVPISRQAARRLRRRLGLS